MGLGKDRLPRSFLLPGDPARAKKIANSWDSYEILAESREFTSYRGTYQGTPIGVISTGIGGPALSIVVEELAMMGVRTMVRVGSCGSVLKGVRVGDIVISKAAARFDGASRTYAPPEYPASADPLVFCALVEAAERAGVRYHTGVTASFDSFYAGQARPGFKGFLPPGSKSWLSNLQRLNIKNVEMEAATLFTIANIYDIAAGAVCAVFANRVTNEFGEEGEREAILVANETIKSLAQRAKV